MRSVIRTIAELLGVAAARYGRRTAVSFIGGPSLSFADIEARAGRLAGGLIARGISAGQRVVLYLPNGPAWLLAYHALARLGAVVVPGNILLTPAEIGWIADDAEAAAVILPAEREAAVTASQSRRPAFVTETDLELLLSADWHAPITCAPQDLFTIGYTSGTTGRPKGAMQSHRAVAASVAMTATVHVRHAGDRILSALPFAHVYGNVVLNSALLAGARLFVPLRFDAGEAIAAIDAHAITLFEGVPTMYYQMLGHPTLSGARLGSLSRCTVGGQTMPSVKIAEVVQRFGCPLLELWGMTEVAGPAITHSPYWPPRPGSIGLPFPGTEVRIAGLDSGDAPISGEMGEIRVRGPLVTDGYWRNPAATTAALDRDGWLATGDVGYVDADGYVFVVDRLKDMIITGGYNIYPAELEQVLALHPAVAMSAVAGTADAEKGEIAQAFVVLAEGHAADAATLDAHCREHLAAYKAPRRYVFVDELPKTSTGKIMRRALREPASMITR